MIKTKTPRHWGGGIRQVSLPMLTSRLSNKRGGRTNGWKDYSRNANNARRFSSTNVYNPQILWSNLSSRIILSVYSTIDSVQYGLSFCTASIYRSRRAVDLCLQFDNNRIYLFKQYDNLSRFGCIYKHGIHSDSFRLTLKGVA